ncbi:MAG: radical SAM protein [Planctomycetota bacterium]
MNGMTRKLRRFLRMARGFGLWSTVVYSVQNRTGLYPALLPLHLRLTRRQIAEVRATGRTPLPRFLSIYPTWRCNLRCRMCHQEGRAEQAAKEEFTLDQFRGLLDGPNGRYVNSIRFLGGEAFVRPDFPEMMDLCDARGISFIITTNGTFFTEEMVRRLEGYRNLGGIVLSLDGPEAIHNAIRRRPFAFEKLIEGVRRFRRKELLSFNSVITAENIDQLEALLDVAADLGVRRLGFNLEGYLSPADIEASTKAVRAWTGQEIDVGGNIHEDGEPPAPLAKLEERCRAALAHAEQRGLEVSLEPRMFTRDLGLYVSGDTLGKGLICRDLTTQPHCKVDPSGNVFPCEGIPTTFGNIFEESLPEIWNSSAYCEFRRRLANGLLPRCRRCCALIPAGKEPAG